MNDLNASLTNITEAEFDALFGDEPIANINENNVVLGKQDSKEPVVQTSKANDIPFFDINSLEEAEVIEEEKKEEETKDEVIPAKPEKKKKEEIVATKATPEIVEVLKNSAKFLIEKGYWKDFEGSEEVLDSLDDETYGELAEKQYEALREEIKAQTIESTGDYGKAIIEYTQNGGNPDEVIDLFKEQKAVESISIDTEAGQRSLIEKWYTEVYDWSTDKAKKYINGLIASDELEGEAQEIDGKYKEHFQKELENLQIQQKLTQQQEQEKQKKFVQTINSKLGERKDLSEKDRKLIQESVFKYDSALADGTKVNKFYLKFAEKQKDPDEYLDMVHFIMDKKGYIEKIKKQEDIKNVNKEWKFISKNAATAKTAGSKHETPEETKKLKNLDFSVVLNK